LELEGQDAQPRGIQQSGRLLGVAAGGYWTTNMLLKPKAQSTQRIQLSIPDFLTFRHHPSIRNVFR
jgi:hypothetical protein